MGADSKTLHIMLVQSYGFIWGPADPSPGAVGSRARLDKAILIAQELEEHPGNQVVFVFPQAYGPGPIPGLPFDNIWLGRNMANYVRTVYRNSIGRDIYVMTDPKSWGTWDDIGASIWMVRQYATTYSRVVVHLVSDPVHLKRVAIAWARQGPPEWEVEYHPASAHRLSWRERWLREPIARLVYRFR